MIVGVPKEVKDHEYRVGMIPAGANALVRDGHTVLIQAGAGFGSGITDEEYAAVGAEIIPDVEEVWKRSEMVVKVKEPVASEYSRLQNEQVLFTYLHLAPLPELTDVLLERKITGIAYETITARDGSLPLLTPMSEVAGRMSVLVGSYYLQRPYGGRGTLPSGVPGVPPCDVIIVGGGIVGLNAAKMALGLGAKVTILETSPQRMRDLDNLFHGQVVTVASNHHNLIQGMRRADVLVGAVLIPGHSAPKLVTRDMLSEMKPRSVIVDVSVDQGGCFETTRPTTHSEPVYDVDDVIHYCVANMPGAVPRTSTFALVNATLPYMVALAGKGVHQAVAEDSGLLAGINTAGGFLTCEPVAESQGRPFRAFESLN